MTEHATLQIISGWLLSLSQLLRHDKEKPTKNQIALYATMLAKDLPSGAFTSESLHHVARDMQWWPEYSALSKALLPWWNEHKPAVAPVIAYEGAVQLSTLDSSWVSFYYQRIKEGGDRRLLGSLIRSQSREAWNVITSSGGDRG